MIKNFKLFENPNIIFYNNEEIKWIQQLTICFSYYNGIMVTGRRLTHQQLYSHFILNNNVETDYDIYHDEFGRGDYSGRIFLKDKIVTFWEFPKNKEHLKEIIKDIEKEEEIKIWNNGYKIEIINDKYEDKFLKNKWGTKEPKEEKYLQYIPLENYKGIKINYNIGIDVPHITSPFKKKKKFIKGFGSLSSKGKQPLKWKQAKLKSEKIKTLSEFSKENY